MLYVPIQVVFIPFALIGLVVAIYKEMVRSRELGVSFSAIKALQYRWFMHHFGTRPDPLSVKFIKEFPCESNFGLWSTLGALIVSQRLFGFTTNFSRLDEPGEETLLSSAGRRVLTFDEIVERYAVEMGQIVIPGAGFDLIALRSTRGTGAKVFELDQENTLNVKVETLQRAGIEHDWVTYVPVDYANEAWADKLLAAGFDRTRKTLFLWQSVSLFLEADTVKETLRTMAELCVDGSVIAQDFYSKAFISGETSRTVSRSLKTFERMGEAWRFGIDMASEPRRAVESFLEQCGLQMVAYFQFGEKRKTEPFYCIVEAVKQR